MTEKRYKALMARISNCRSKGLLLKLNKLFPKLFAFIYIFELLILLFKKDRRFLRALLVPAAVFILVTRLRKKLGRKRPYIVYGTAPVTGKSDDEPGHPSRHAASSFIIAFTSIRLFGKKGITVLVFAVITAALRVILGVHYISDVLAGAVIALISGIIGFLAIK
ncbi:MAG: phosphatase PAP2 family protein [Lachnospiraceae bacterium]|nr:phosphatase PAP2 family protein [Lachnospiraceae bacterium]